MWAGFDRSIISALTLGRCGSVLFDFSSNDLSTPHPFDFINARFRAAPSFSHEFQDAFVDRFLVHVFQSVAEKRRRLLLGGRGVDEAVERDALLFG